MSVETTYACQPATTRGQCTHLGADSEGKRLIYTSGRNVIIRDIDDPFNCVVYRDHGANVTAAQFAPSGYYVCSGDARGNVRIWATNDDRTLKAEYQMLSGAVKDICWSPDNQRIVVVGEGKEQFGKAFIWDTGSSVGEISGHAKTLNSVAFRPARPFRVMTGGEDFMVNYFEGPPFKFKAQAKEHSNFVNCVRYSPDASYCVSVGSDKKIVFYEGKTGELAKTIENAHAGSIYACSWSPDSKKLLTSSADKSVKIWNVETKECEKTFKLGNSINEMQVGCIWAGQHLVALALNGDITILDEGNVDSPKAVISGHNRSIDCVATGSDGMFFTGDFNGEIHAWRNGQPSSKRVAGKGHSCVVDMKVSADELVSVGLDDVLRRTKISDSMSYGGAAVKLPGAPTGLAVADDAAIVSSANGLAVVKGDNVVFHYEDPAGVKFNCVAVDSSGKTVAAGSEKGAVVVFDLNGDGSLVVRHTLSLHAAGVCSIAVSTDGAFIASADNKSVFLWDAVDGQIKVKTWQGFHNSLIKSVDFAKDGKRIISASADESVIVWSVDEPDKVQKLSWTHAGGASGAKFLNDSHFVSVGSDACVKVWKF